MNKQKKTPKQDFKQNYLRALADYQNLEKRVREEKEETARRSKSELIVKLLNVLDNIEKAEVFVKDEGLRMVKKQLAETLEAEGLQEMEVLGKVFDPHLAEALEVVESDKDNLVLEVFRKGYKLGDRIVRPAQVRVGKKILNQAQD